MEKNVENTAAAQSNLLFPPERIVMGAAEAARKVQKCSDYNDSRSEARNFCCFHFQGITFKGEDLSGAEAAYALFTDCIFEETRLNRMEGHFAVFNNCQFKNCTLENSDFSFATISDCNFYNCNLKGCDFPFASGNFSAVSCMMERATFNNSTFFMNLTSVNGTGLEANCAKIEIDAVSSSLRRAEFNDSTLAGKISRSDLSDAEFNRSDLSALSLENNASHGIEAEDAEGFDDVFDQAFEEALNDLEFDED